MSNKETILGVLNDFMLAERKYDNAVEAINKIGNDFLNETVVIEFSRYGEVPIPKSAIVRALEEEKKEASAELQILGKLLERLTLEINKFTTEQGND